MPGIQTSLTSNSNMWHLVVVMVLLESARGCGNVDGTSLESLGSVDGRYVLRWCDENTREFLKLPQVMWDSAIRVDDRPPANCGPRSLKSPHNSSSRYHSQLKEVRAADVRCSPTCMSSTLDLIYAGCYTIQHKVYRYNRNYQQTNASATHYIHIDNGYTFDYFNSSNTMISAVSFQNDVKIKVHFGSIPLLNYSLRLYTLKDFKSVAPSLSVSNCSQSPYLLDCLSHDLQPGHYEVLLQHYAPWTNGQVFNVDGRLVRIVHQFEHTTEGRSPEVPASRTMIYVWSSVAGVLLVLAMCGAGWLLWRQRTRDIHVMENVKNDWRARLSDEKEAESCEEEDTYGPILLLYARDAEPFMDAMVLLRTLLAEHTGCKVYDLVEASTMHELATAPTEWIRHAVSSSRMRLVLVETPAAQHLYCGAPGPDQPQEPLLSTRALYRRPNYCDTLLQYALRLARDDTKKHYHKYYVATLSMFPAEVVPTVAPFRRYQLPQHAARLACDLAPGRPATPFPELEQRLSTTLDRFSGHARDNPHYLQDELMFL